MDCCQAVLTKLQEIEEQEWYTMWHPDLEEDVEHPTVSLALIYRRFKSRHFGLPVSLVCHYRGIKKSWNDAVSVCILPLHKLFWQKILQKIAEMIPG